MTVSLNLPLAYKGAGSSLGALVYMPEGTHEIHALINGRAGTQRVVVDKSCLPAFQRDLDQKKSKNVRPVCLFDHKNGPASFIPSEFDYEDGVGVILRGEWTASGKGAVDGRDYSYFSPTFRLNKQTCRPAGLEPDAVEIGSLVNDPAFESIVRIAACRVVEAGYQAEPKPGNSNNHQATEMIKKMVELGFLTEEEAQQDNVTELAMAKLEELKAKLAKCDEESAEVEAARTKLAEVEDRLAECSAAREQLAGVQAELESARAELAAVQAGKAELIEAEIQAAVQAGKIAPSDDDAKKGLRIALEADIRAGKALIAAMPINPVFTNIVAGKAQSKEETLCGRERIAKAIEEEYKQTH